MGFGSTPEAKRGSRQGHRKEEQRESEQEGQKEVMGLSMRLTGLGKKCGGHGGCEGGRMRGVKGEGMGSVRG